MSIVCNCKHVAKLKEFLLTNTLLKLAIFRNNYYLLRSVTSYICVAKEVNGSSTLCGRGQCPQRGFTYLQHA